MAGQVVINLANVIRCNPNLEDLYLMNNELKSSASLILTALRNLRKLKNLNCFLAESTRVELVTAIKSNPLITELWLGDNMLQSGLIDITIHCKSLENLQALELSHNCVSPTQTVHLALATSVHCEHYFLEVLFLIFKKFFTVRFFKFTMHANVYRSIFYKITVLALMTIKWLKHFVKRCGDFGLATELNSAII